MTTTSEALEGLLARVNAATVTLQTAPEVPEQIGELVDSFDPALHAEAPLQLEANPYLTTMLFAAAFRAEKALRHDDSDVRRRDVRIALEQFRHALRDIVSNRPFDADTPVRDVLVRTLETVSIPQKDLAELLSVSTRHLQRWIASDGPTPSGADEARVRVVGQIVNQLKHSFTGPGVLAWFYRAHPSLGLIPKDVLDEPLKYPDLLSAATASRAMTA